MHVWLQASARVSELPQRLDLAPPKRLPPSVAEASSVGHLHPSLLAQQALVASHSAAVGLLPAQPALVLRPARRLSEPRRRPLPSEPPVPVDSTLGR